MQVFKTFLKIAKKKFPSVLLYYIIFTVVVIAMSKIGASDHETSFTATKADIYIIDEDNSTASHALSDYLSSMHNPVTLKDTDTMTLQDALYYQKVDYILTIPEGFEEQLTDSDARDFLPVSMRKDNSNGYFVDQQVTEYLSSVRLFMAGGFSLSEAVTKSSESLSKGNDTTVLKLEEKETDGAQIGLTYFFQYLPYVLINMLLLGMTPILMTFNQKDLGARISCSSLSLKSRNAQITLGCIVFSLFVWLLFILTALFIYGHSVLDKRTPLSFKQCHGSAVFHSTYAPCKYFCTQTAVPQYDCKCCLPGIEFPLRNLRSAIPFGKRCSCCGAFSSNLLVYPPQFHAGRYIG